VRNKNRNPVQLFKKESEFRYMYAEVFQMAWLFPYVFTVKLLKAPIKSVLPFWAILNKNSGGGANPPVTKKK